MFDDDDDDDDVVSHEFGGGCASSLSQFSDASNDESQNQSSVTDLPDTLGDRLLFAAEHGDAESVDSLLDEHPHLITFQDSDGYTALHRASSHSQMDVVASLLGRGAALSSRTDDRWTPLHCAAYWNHAKCAAVLLRAGADVNATSSGGLTPLHLVSSQGSQARETLLLLLSWPFLRGDIVSDAGDTPAQLAARSGHCEQLFQVTDVAVNMV